MNPSARELPLVELEDAREHAEILLDKYATLLSEELSALLSAWDGYLTVIIEDLYGLTPADHALRGGDAG